MCTDTLFCCIIIACDQFANNNNSGMLSTLATNNLTTKVLQTQLGENTTIQHHSHVRLLFGVLYCPPKSGLGYLNHLCSSLFQISVSIPIVLCGDFNVANIDWDVTSPSLIFKHSGILFMLLSFRCNN